MILATFKMLRLFLTNVPHQWWFLVVMVISFAFGVAYNEVYNTGLPVWAILYCAGDHLHHSLRHCGLASQRCAPVPRCSSVVSSQIQATTNSEVTLNVVSEIIAGYALPNRPVANMLFKCLSLAANPSEHALIVLRTACQCSPDGLSPTYSSNIFRWIRIDGSSGSVCLRHEAGPLHAHSTADALRGADGGLHLGLLRLSRCTRLAK